MSNNQKNIMKKSIYNNKIVWNLHEENQRLRNTPINEKACFWMGNKIYKVNVFQVVYRIRLFQSKYQCKNLGNPKTAKLIKNP